MTISTWSHDDAKREFARIEKSKGQGEWFDIEWKRELCFEDTNYKRNTTQKAISGFANTYGGNLIIGIEDKGKVVGTIKQRDIENHLAAKLKKKLQPEIPLFQAKYYTYKEKDILVIFVQESKRPIQCDNGVYYHRDQSQFIPLPHLFLEEKFRRYFDEEKYLYFIIDELDRLQGHATILSNKAGDEQRKGGRGTAHYRISPYTYYLKQSGEKLYSFFREHNLLTDYLELMKKVNWGLAGEQIDPKDSAFFGTLKRDAEQLKKKLIDITSNGD